MNVTNNYHRFRLWAFALFVTMLAFPMYGYLPQGQQSHQSIRVKVLDLDQAVGIASDICLDTNYPDCPFPARIGTTDSNGELVARYSCRPQDKVFALPSDSAYYASKRFACMPTNIQVSSRSAVRSLTGLVAEAEKRGDYAGEALIANELAARLSDVDATNAARYESIAYSSTARALNVSAATVTDPEQGKTVMSPTLKNKISDFQIRQNIYSSTDGRLGNLDYQTLSTLAGKSLSSAVSGLRTAK